MITVIINGSIVSHNSTHVQPIKTIITMFEIRKEIVNSIGNVQHYEIITYLNCDNHDNITPLVKDFNRVAQAETIKYKLRGQDLYVRYCFIYKPLSSYAELAKRAFKLINEAVDVANRTVHDANANYKYSARKRHIKADDAIEKRYSVQQCLEKDYKPEYSIVIE